jgi:hypothetical protein
VLPKRWQHEAVSPRRSRRAQAATPSARTIDGERNDLLGIRALVARQLHGPGAELSRSPLVKLGAGRAHHRLRSPQRPAVTNKQFCIGLLLGAAFGADAWQCRGAASQGARAEPWRSLCRDRRAQTPLLCY